MALADLGDGAGGAGQLLRGTESSKGSVQNPPGAHLSTWAFSRPLRPQPSSLLSHPHPFSQQPLAAPPSECFQNLPLLCLGLLPGHPHHYIPFGESHSLFAVFLLPVPTHFQRDLVNTCVRALPPSQSPPVAPSHLGKNNCHVIHKAPRDLQVPHDLSLVLCTPLPLSGPRPTCLAVPTLQTHSQPRPLPSPAPSLGPLPQNLRACLCFVT